MDTENIKDCIKHMEEGGGPQYERWAGKASHELRALEARVRELRAAVKLAKDMFIANDLDLPHTFEVLDEALTNSEKEG